MHNLSHRQFGGGMPGWFDVVAKDALTFLSPSLARLKYHRALALWRITPGICERIGNPYQQPLSA
jgi:hypothetical protein